MENQSIKVTVYIPSHNYGKYLGNAIESVLRQTITDWELIIIDDNSSDNTQEVMRLYEGHPSISIHRTDGIGLPAVCNFAIVKAKGEYVIRLDGDDVFDENILLVLSHYLDSHPEAALVFPDYYLMDEYGQIYAQERRERVYSENHMLDMPPNGACTLIRKSVMTEVNGYREDLGSQDGLDLWTKLIKNKKCFNVNLPLFYYRRHGENLTKDVQRILAARRQIKRDVIDQTLLSHRPIIGVIPIRKNYDFVPNLWSQKLNGRSLLSRDIEVCLSSTLLDYVVVACDDPEVEHIIAEYQEPRLKFFLREPQSTTRTASVAKTLEKIAEVYDPESRGITVLRYIQTPFVSKDTLEEAITTLALNEADSSSGVEAINAQVFRRGKFGLEPINRFGGFYSDFDIVYKDAMVCLATKNANLKRGSLTGSSIVSFEISAAESFFMISSKDLKIAQLIASKKILQTA